MESSCSFEELTAEELSLLKTDTRGMQILNCTSEADEGACHIKAGFPVNVATTFSEVIRNNIDKAEFGPPGPNFELTRTLHMYSTGIHYAFTVGQAYGGIPRVLQFMLNWCDGKRTLPEPYMLRYFCGVFQAEAAAKVLKIPTPLQKVIDDEVKSICTQSTPDHFDIEYVYSTFPEGHHARQMTLAAYASTMDTAADIDIGDFYVDLLNDMLKDHEDEEGKDEARSWVKPHLDSCRAVAEDLRTILPPDPCDLALHELESDEFDDLDSIYGHDVSDENALP